MAEEIENLGESEKELYDAARSEDWNRCRELLELGVKTDYIGNVNHWSLENGWNAFVFAMRKGQTELVRMMMETDPDVQRKNSHFILRQVFDEEPSFGDRRSCELMQLVLRGNPDASNLMGCYHLINGELRLAVRHFYDQMTPMPSVEVLILRAFQVAVRYEGHRISLYCDRIFGIMGTDLRDEECLQILSWLIAETNDGFFLLREVTESILLRCPVSLEGVCDIIQLLDSLVVAQAPSRNLYDAISSAGRLLLRLYAKERLSEDQVSRIADTIAGTEARHGLLVSDFFKDCRNMLSYSEWFDVIKFLIVKCNCDPDCRNIYGKYALNWTVSDYYCKMFPKVVVPILLAGGAHPCVRDMKGVPAFELFPSVGLPALGVRTLKCIAASYVVEAKIKFGEEDLPRELHKFLELH